MLPSCGWSHEIFIVETGPMFSRSIYAKSVTASMNAWSFVMTLAASV